MYRPLRLTERLVASKRMDSELAIAPYPPSFEENVELLTVGGSFDLEYSPPPLLLLTVLLLRVTKAAPLAKMPPPALLSLRSIMNC